jgi:pimeloyl-ACP methyl ester carboxylesterase
VRIVLIALLAAISTLPLNASAQSIAHALRFHECAEGKSKVPAECGSLRVFENRGSASGRTIQVYFVLLKAVHPNGHVIYVNLGGPASELAEVPDIADGAALKELSALHDRYDVLFVDERGFGLSHPLPCGLVPLAEPAVYFRALWSERRLADCRMKNAQSSDLSQYNTPAAIEDLNDLRAALGYRQLIFDVGSYGTFTALVYMRRYPENVESAVLQGVAPPGILAFARDFASGSQVSLDRLSDECERDARCRAAFPKFREHFLALLHRFANGPVPVRVQNDVTNREETVLLSREVFVDVIRHALYSPESAAYLPLVIERAYRNDTLPLGGLVDLITQAYSADVDAGGYLSYTCAELMPFANSAADLDWAKSYSWFGDDRIAAQQRACSIWNVPALSGQFYEPVSSAVPILMVSGTDDPATPSYEGTQELKYLSNARQMLVANAPHDAESPCTDRVVERFVRAGSWAGLDITSCKGTFERPPFLMTWPPQ